MDAASVMAAVRVGDVLWSDDDYKVTFVRVVRKTKVRLVVEELASDRAHVPGDFTHDRNTSKYTLRVPHEVVPGQHQMQLRPVIWGDSDDDDDDILFATGSGNYLRHFHLGSEPRVKTVYY